MDRSEASYLLQLKQIQVECNQKLYEQRLPNLPGPDTYLITSLNDLTSVVYEYLWSLPRDENIRIDEELRMAVGVPRVDTETVY